MSWSMPPGVYVEDISSGIRTIPGAETSTPAFIGLTARTSAPKLVHSWDEFEESFAGPDGEAAALQQAVQGYFANGGATCYVMPLNEAVTPGAPGDIATSTEALKSALSALEDKPEVTSLVVPDLYDMPGVTDEASAERLVDLLADHCAAKCEQA
ncbi:hypothetical protein OV450_5281 [Actinobacteria bacterium OV450]|nr:hypothetical protein OV450_5281 [Actinobacteria bacterium OV450]